MTRVIGRTQFIDVKNVAGDHRGTTRVVIRSEGNVADDGDVTYVEIRNFAALMDLEKEARDEVKQVLLHEVCYGDTVYPLRHDGLNVRYTPTPSQIGKPCEFWSEVFSPPLRGKGATSQEARNDWEYQFHVKFQELYTKCEFERSEEEEKLWLIFEAVVNIPAYQAKRRFSFREIGQISVDSQPDQSVREINWIDDRKETIDCKSAPPEFVIFRQGEYFEAEVLRSSSGELLRILAIRSVDYCECKADEFLDALPSSKDLPTLTNWK